MAIIKYLGLPEDINAEEEATKKILDFKVENVIKSFQAEGRLQEINEIILVFNNVKSDLKKLFNSDEVKNDGVSAYFCASEPLFRMEQIILPQSTIIQIEESLKLLEYQDLIFNTWGFKQIEPNYKVALNFFGPPGTGKTMMAHAIAHYMHKKIIAVDYAQIESKFVGDAPKNLEIAFRTATEKDAILFFDEADSFLGKRIAGISTGSEQAINSLRSQMLLALDKFSGVVLFASNFVENYDKAFETRIRHIQFNLPDKLAIEKILRSMIPPNAPVFAINYTELTEQCNGLSGRDLKNCLLLAATKAASGKRDFITQEMILEAIKVINQSLNSFHEKQSIKKYSDIVPKIHEKLLERRNDNEC